MRWLLVLLFLSLLLPVACGDDPSASSGQADDQDTSPDDDAVGDDDEVADDDAIDDDAVDDDIVDDDAVDDDAADDDIYEYPDYPNDEFLQLNHLQALGTHNSYHIKPPEPFVFPGYRYTHASLDEQLDIGVRQFELDIHWIYGQGLKVFHAPIIDPLSTCDTLIDCLTVIKGWSDAHPGHHALIVFLEPKDDLNVNRIHEHVDDVEADILAVLPRERILTPDDVRGDYETLNEAITIAGWPTLGVTRDKIILHAHNSGLFRDNYLLDHPNLEGRLMFTDARVDDPWAAILPMNDPIGSAAQIGEAVEAGFIVRTRADSCCKYAINNDHTRHEAALVSGAHAVSTDFPQEVPEYDYWVDIPEGAPSRCNPLIAPEFCTSLDIEALPQ